MYKNKVVPGRAVHSYGIWLKDPNTHFDLLLSLIGHDTGLGAEGKLVLQTVFFLFQSKIAGFQAGCLGGGGKLDNFQNKKSPKSTRVDYNKTNKAQAVASAAQHRGVKQIIYVTKDPKLTLLPVFPP